MSDKTLPGIGLIVAIILITILVFAGIFAVTEGKKAAAELQASKTEQIRLEVEKVRAEEKAKLEMAQLKAEAEQAEQEMEYEHELQVMRTQLDELWERQVLFEHNLILLAQVEQAGSAEEIEAVLARLDTNQSKFKIDWAALILGTICAVLAFLGFQRYYKLVLKGLFNDSL
jgi:hypothetical protein